MNNGDQFPGPHKKLEAEGDILDDEPVIGETLTDGEPVIEETLIDGEPVIDGLLIEEKGNVIDIPDDASPYPEKATISKDTDKENGGPEDTKMESGNLEANKTEDTNTQDKEPEDNNSENNNSEDAIKETQGPAFLKTLRSLGVDENLIDISEDVLCEPVEILLNLAKSEDIDPWDIDIVEITDKFLEYIEEMKLTDLRISGRTLLYAAILLRMKSTGIVQEEEEEEDDEPEEDMDFYDIEEYPVPKLPIRRTATRPVTLQELITELKKAERVETRRKDRIRHQLQDKVEIATTDDVLAIAHEEDIKGMGEMLYSRISVLFNSREYITFSELTSDNFQDKTDRIMVYISLLFLAAEKKIWLSQKELFGELYIHPGPPEEPDKEQSELSLK